jgi:hypothetical protein
MVTKNITYVLIGVAVLCLFVVGVYAVTTLTAPEHAAGTPTTAPTSTPTPTPTVTTVATELHMASNNTVPFYKGSTLHIEAQLNVATAGITVTLYNNGAVITTALTDSTGKAVFDRNPTNAYDYTVTATIP